MCSSAAATAGMYGYVRLGQGYPPGTDPGNHHIHTRGPPCHGPSLPAILPFPCRFNEGFTDFCSELTKLSIIHNY